MTVARPSLTNTAGIYALNFTDEKISVQIDRINENSKHETTGELVITSRVPGRSGHVHQSRLNLTSSSTRSTLAKNLTEKFPGVEWVEVLEYVCTMILAKHREGTPVIKLADHAMPDGLSFRLLPFLQERQATLLFGEGDTGKSWLGILMSVLVSQGLSHVGMMAEAGNVLYLDYETDEDTLWERVNMISAGLGIPIPDGIFYRQMHQLLASDFQQISKLVAENDISLVVVDSAAPAVGEPESSAPTNEYFAALRSLRTSTLTIAHVSKGGKENEPFGSIFWRNLPRANFRVSSSHEPGASQFIIGLKHTKSNNGKRMKDKAFELNFSDGAVTFTDADPTTVPDLVEHLSHGQRLSSALRRGAMSIQELEGVLGLSYHAIYQALSRGEGKQWVTFKDNDLTYWANKQPGS